MKSSLIINTKPPHSGQATKEAQDACLAFAAFGVELGVLFLEDGLFQLKSQQQPSQGQKNTAAVFESFPLYDISKVYVCKEDLERRHLNVQDLQLEVKVIQRSEVAQLLTEFDNVLSF